MARAITKHPSGIPVSVKRNGIIIRKISVWRNLLERFHFLSRRLPPGAPGSVQRRKKNETEKKNTQKRKELAIELRNIENDLLRRLGRITKHPDLYTPPTRSLPRSSRTVLPLELQFSPHDTMQELLRKERAQNKFRDALEISECKARLDPDTLSVRSRLLRIRASAQVRSWSSLNPLYRRREGRTHTQTRHRVAQELMDLEWKWLSALYARIFPDRPLPPRRIVHPSRYTP
jgi:hypothetical protein